MAFVAVEPVSRSNGPTRLRPLNSIGENTVARLDEFQARISEWPGTSGRNMFLTNDKTPKEREAIKWYRGKMISDEEARDRVHRLCGVENEDDLLRRAWDGTMRGDEGGFGAAAPAMEVDTARGASHGGIGGLGTGQGGQDRGDPPRSRGSPPP